MHREHINPAGLWNAPSYTQVITTQGGTLVHIAGQPAYDQGGNVVSPGDLGAQIEKALANVEVALKAAGAQWSDVVKMISYVVDYRPEHRALLGRIRDKFYTGTPPTTTLIGVQSLAQPGVLYEVDVTAVIE